MRPALKPPFSDGAEFCLDRANMTKKPPFFSLGTAGRYFISLAENIRTCSVLLVLAVVVLLVVASADWSGSCWSSVIFACYFCVYWLGLG